MEITGRRTQQAQNFTSLANAITGKAKQGRPMSIMSKRNFVSNLSSTLTNKLNVKVNKGDKSEKCNCGKNFKCNNFASPRQVTKNRTQTSFYSPASTRAYSQKRFDWMTPSRQGNKNEEDISGGIVMTPSRKYFTRSKQTWTDIKSTYRSPSER